MWDIAVPARAELGERPVWDDADDVLIWADITAGRLQRHRPGGIDDHIQFADTVGAAGLRRDGGYVVAAGRELVLVNPDGTMPTRIQVAPSGVRFNDAAVDPMGRFWAGTVGIGPDPILGTLYRLDPDLSVHAMLEGVAESNGLAWNIAGDAMYFIDSGQEVPTLRKFAYDLVSGALGQAVDLIVFAPGEGVPDGLTIDDEDCLWVAMWGGSAVRRYSPTGELMLELTLPVGLVTCPGFGGPDLQTLYVTTAWEGQDPPQRLAGNLFSCRPGPRGLPAARFST